jgi:tRNA(fMet)-specific endonuclease VapC
MNYLLDTNIWSRIQRADPRVLASIRRLPAGARLCMPVVAAGELLAGVEASPDGKRKQELQRLYQELLERTAEVIDIDIEAAERFALIVGQLRRDGRPIETNDIWIAATAMARGFIIVSNDADFTHVAGLQVEDWTIGAVE